jgi:adenylate cyclase
MASGLILFTYIGAHLLNHAFGLISLDTAEAGMVIATEVWYSIPGTALLYGAAATHFAMALWAVYERRTFRLPPAELLRIALGFTMPMLLIGHAASTRLAYDLYGLSSDYTRVVSNLWATGSQGWQLGLMAPGWIHGCLGLHFAFSRRSWYRRSSLVLFAVALLLPVFSGLGFIAMGRELAVNPTAAAEARAFYSPQNAPQRLAIEQWKNNLLNWYFAIIGAAFIARELRNVLERKQRGLVSVSYPAPAAPCGCRGAGRCWRRAAAITCRMRRCAGGRARCSTCRVRVTAGLEHCPPPAQDEKATLERIGASPGVRLACQLRPVGDISVVPLVRTARPIYRPAGPRRSGEREVVLLRCDLLNRAEFAHDHLPQDLLYVVTLYIEGVGNAIRAAGGALSIVEFDGVCALFGLYGGEARAAQAALRAAGAIEGVVADLNSRLGRRHDSRLKIAVSTHAGRAAISEIAAFDPPMPVAVGEAVDVVDRLRAVAAGRGKAFAISADVYAGAGLSPPPDGEVSVRTDDAEAATTAYLSDTTPLPSPAWMLHGEIGTRTMLRRLWAG